MVKIGINAPYNPVINRNVLTFNGTSAYGTLSEPIVLSGDFEIEVVFKHISNLAFQSFLSGQGFRCFSIVYYNENNEGGVAFKSAANALVTSSKIILNSYNTVTVVRDNGNIYFIINDGAPVSPFVNTESIVVSSVGKDVSGFGGNDYLNSQIFSIKITDNSSATPIVYEYQLNNGRTDSQLPSGKTSPQINWSNITKSDYTRYVLHREFSPARWVSEVDSSYIEVAT